MSEPARQLEQHERDDFHANRLLGIGGSEAAAACGLSAYRSPLNIYAEKTGELAGFKGNTITEFGHIFEDTVAQEAARRNGWKIRRKRKQIVHPKYQFMRAHLDRYAYDDVRDRGVMQVKTAWDGVRAKWEDRDEPPRDPQIQIQHEMECAQVGWGCLAYLFVPSREIVVFPVVPNGRFVSLMIAREAALWKCIEDRTPPELSSLNPDSDIEALTALHQKDEIDIPKDMDPALAEFDQMYVEGNDLEKKGKDLKKQAKAHLMEALAGHATGVLDGVAKYTWKEQHREEKVTPASTFRVFRRYALKRK